jgi:hypothetical protein
LERSACSQGRREETGEADPRRAERDGGGLHTGSGCSGVVQRVHSGANKESRCREIPKTKLTQRKLTFFTRKVYIFVHQFKIWGIFTPIILPRSYPDYSPRFDPSLGSVGPRTSTPF